METESQDDSSGVGPAFRRWFRTPPRAHGEFDEERVVSFLELFYDLVYVVLIAQIAHTLAGDVSWARVGEFAVLFAMIWLAWLNGSLYHELHGREDGRSRSFIFVQMLLLVLLAVYAGHAADEDGRGFAITYAVLLGVLAFQWLGVRRHDAPEFAALTARYLAGIAVFIAAVLISAVVDDPDIRVLIWAMTVAVVYVGTVVTFSTDPTAGRGFLVTESMAERFGLFTIIVLGEVVVGVADGLSEAERDATVIATGLIALCVGFGYWWNYFDFAGRRVTRPGQIPAVVWMNAHLPLTMSIAAAGAAMVSLIEHAGDDRAPAPTAWLLAAGSAVVLLSLATIVAMIDDPRTLRIRILVAAAVAVLLVGALRPSPLVLVIALAFLLMATWTVEFVRAARAGSDLVAR